MINIEMIKMETSAIDSENLILTVAFFPYKHQEKEIKNYYKDTKQFQDVYDKNFEFIDRNITIISLLNSQEEADLLMDAIRTKNLTSIIMQSNHKNNSVKCLCEQLIKYFDITKAVI